MPTIRDVARACNLSAMTVSSVLNGKAGEASEETRARVLQAVEELGYHPNEVARGLARRRMDTIGVVVSFNRPSLTTDRYLIITETNWEDMPSRISRYRDGHRDGLTFVTSTFRNEKIDPLIHSKMPLLFLGENRPELPVSVVDIEVDVHDPQAGSTSRSDRQRRIVVDTEP